MLIVSQKSQLFRHLVILGIPDRSPDNAEICDLDIAE